MDGKRNWYAKRPETFVSGLAFTQQHLNQLNDKAIDLYTLARQNYDTEGDEMRSNLSAYQTAESMERSNYESDRADYYNRLTSLREGEAAERQQYLDDLNQYNTERDYDQSQQQIAWDQHMDEQSVWEDEQDRAWTQYTYWNDLWENSK